MFHGKSVGYPLGDLCSVGGGPDWYVLLTVHGLIQVRDCSVGYLLLMVISAFRSCSSESSP
jgi:hypothetical protein